MSLTPATLNQLTFAIGSRVAANEIAASIETSAPLSAFTRNQMGIGLGSSAAATEIASVLAGTRQPLSSVAYQALFHGLGSRYAANEIAGLCAGLLLPYGRDSLGLELNPAHDGLGLAATSGQPFVAWGHPALVGNGYVLGSDDALAFEGRVMPVNDGESGFTVTVEAHFDAISARSICGLFTDDLASSPFYMQQNADGTLEAGVFYAEGDEYCRATIAAGAHVVTALFDRTATMGSRLSIYIDGTAQSITSFPTGTNLDGVIYSPVAVRFRVGANDLPALGVIGMVATNAAALSGATISAAEVWVTANYPVA